MEVLVKYTSLDKNEPHYISMRQRSNVVNSCENRNNIVSISLRAYNNFRSLLDISQIHNASGSLLKVANIHWYLAKSPLKLCRERKNSLIMRFNTFILLATLASTVLAMPVSHCEGQDLCISSCQQSYKKCVNLYPINQWSVASSLLKTIE